MDAFRNKETGQISVMRYAIDEQTGFRVAYGDLIPISKEELEQRGVEAILPYLAQPKVSQPSRTSFLQRMSASERRRFRNQNVAVSIWSPKADEVVIQALCREAGGDIGTAEQRIVLRFPIRSSEFMQALQLAFDNSE